MDKIVKITGKITKIKEENSYEKNKFIVMELKDMKNGEQYDAEVSPLWFYKVDIVEGSLIELRGSLNNINNKKIVLTQPIIFAGEIFNFRDKFGFPLWRGENRAFRIGASVQTKKSEN